MTPRILAPIATACAAVALLAAGCGPAARADEGQRDPRGLDPPCADAASCFDEGVRLQKRMDDPAAIALGVACHMRACDLGHGEACMDAGLQYWGGFFIDQDLGFAQELFERSCALGFGQGCNKAGTMLELGWGGTVDPVAARGFYRRGCDLQDGESCRDLAP